MKTSRLLLALGSLGSLIIAALPVFMISDRLLHSRKALRDIHQRLDVYGSRR